MAGWKGALLADSVPISQNFWAHEAALNTKVDEP